MKPEPELTTVPPEIVPELSVRVSGPPGADVPTLNTDPALASVLSSVIVPPASVITP